MKSNFVPSALRATLTRFTLLACVSAAVMGISGCGALFGDTTQPDSTSASRLTVPPGYYRVNPGDSLNRIAAAFGQPPQNLVRWNGLASSTAIVPNQLLRVAPPVEAAASPQPAPTVRNRMPDTPATSSPEPAALIWPVQGRVISPYVAGKSRGMLIAATPGEPVKAAAAGRVVYAGTGIPAYGPLVIIKNNDGLITAYGQNARLLVREGRAVKQGQAIAEAGTGKDGQGELQFEVQRHGKQVDPMSLLPGGATASRDHAGNNNLE